VLRGHAGEPEHVLVLETLGAPQRRLLRGRKPARAEPEPEAEPVLTTRATLIETTPLPDEGSSWLADRELVPHALDAVAILNGVLYAHRIAAADPYAREVDLDQAIVARVGIGTGDDVAYGRWTDARTLPTRRDGGRLPRRSAALRPQERLAAILGGRDVALACEELTLRARSDIDGGRHREAALQLRVALEAAIAELVPWAGTADLARRLEELRDLRPAVGAAANRALEGGLDEATIGEISKALTRIEAALRARTAGGIVEPA